MFFQRFSVQNVLFLVTKMGKIFTENLYRPEKNLLNKYIPVVYNPEGFCIDGTTSKEKKQFVNAKDHHKCNLSRPSLVSSSYRLQRLNVSPASETTQNISNGDKTTSNFRQSLRSPSEMKWSWRESIPNFDEDVGWNERSNSFLSSYYELLNQSRGIKNRFTISNTVTFQIYDTYNHNYNSAVFEENAFKNTIQEKKVIETFVVQEHSKKEKQLPSVLLEENQKAKSWLRSYVDVAINQRIKWLDILDACDDIMNDPNKMKKSKRITIIL